jgi:glycosyltransferase involved in cell wall biosynthesis
LAGCLRSADLVSIVKSPGIRLYQRIRELAGPRLMMDINDAVWMGGWPDLPETLAMVDGVICENEYIAEYAHDYNSRVFVVPDSPQIELFDKMRPAVPGDPDDVVLGWVGLAHNIEPLIRILGPLETLFEKYPHLHLRVVGAGRDALPRLKHVRYSCRPELNQSAMIEEVLRFDIGLFPLIHDDSGRARGTLKALVYMSGEAAVVADNYGENPKLIRDGVNGLLASSADEWVDKVERLVIDRDYRLNLAKRGLNTVREGFTAEHIFTRLTDAYDSVLSD